MTQAYANYYYFLCLEAYTREIIQALLTGPPGEVLQADH